MGVLAQHLWMKMKMQKMNKSVVYSLYTLLLHYQNVECKNRSKQVAKRRLGQCQLKQLAGCHPIRLADRVGALPPKSAGSCHLKWMANGGTIQSGWPQFPHWATRNDFRLIHKYEHSVPFAAQDRYQ